MYQIGQVLFVVPTKGSVRVVPIQVVEEITKRTLQGAVTTYMVKATIDNESTVVTIESIEGEIFDSHIALKKSLLERSSNVINKIVNSVVNLANTLYGYNDQPPVSKEVIDDVVDSGGESMAILDDGTKVRIQLPDSLK